MRSCPRCKTSDYNNRYFTLLINECGHSLCKICVDNLFVRQSGPCPVCGRNLKKASYWEQIFDDPHIEKQTFFRKKLQKVFNLKEEDFETLQAFNDYLESVETYVNNLACDVDVEETKRRIEQFQKDNEDLIVKNKNRLSQDDEWIQSYLEEERRRKADMSGAVDSLLPAPTDDQASDARSIIAELMSSDLDANEIVGKRRHEALRDRQAAAVATAAAATHQSAAEITRAAAGDARRRRQQQQVVRMAEASTATGAADGKPYVYVAVQLQINGPPLLPVDRLAELGFLRHIKPASGWQVAGGYTESMGCFRALTEAHVDLFW